MDAFWHSAVLIALAEMGDKSQLIALAYATRYSWRTTLAGISLATLLVHLASVGVGELLGLALPTSWIRLLSGVAFVGFGLWTLRGDTLAAGEAEQAFRYGAFATVTGTFFLSELGDKTMLATITLASQWHVWVGVWLGSTLGMVGADALAIVIGGVLGKRLPERAIRFAAASVFLVLGAGLLWETLAGLTVP